MHQSFGAPIIVGVNCTHQSEIALRWAVDEAALRGLPLRVVSTYFISEPRPLGIGLTAPVLTKPPQVVQTAHERARQYAVDRLGGDRVSGEITQGAPASALRRAANNATILVVGSRSRGTRHSVSHSVAAHAACPTVVVRGARPPDRRRIVAGLDGSRESEHALAFAFEEAALRGSTIEAIHSWTPMGPEAGYRAWIEQTGRNYRRQMADSIAPFRAKYPDVAVVERILEGPPVQRLAEVSADAGLLVVGSRGLGRVIGAFLGSVSQGLLRHAPTAVAVVKHGR